MISPKIGSLILIFVTPSPAFLRVKERGRESPETFGRVPKDSVHNPAPTILPNASEDRSQVGTKGYTAADRDQIGDDSINQNKLRQINWGGEK